MVGVQVEAVESIINQPQGLVLVTGPTGSGKSATLYSLLQQLNQPTRNILTVEDPVEQQLTGINQVAINIKAGLSFSQKAMLATIPFTPKKVLLKMVEKMQQPKD